MKVTFVNYYYDKDIPTSEYINKYPTIHGWCRALFELGTHVDVYQRFSENVVLQKDGVNYYLIKDNNDFNLKWYSNPKIFHKEILNSSNEIIHINSFRYAYQASLLKQKIPSAKIVIQHHAEKPGHRIKQFLLRNFCSSLDGFIFSSKEIHSEWVNVKAISGIKKSAEIMEGSSNFIFMDRDDIRKKTGIKGKPVLLWVGRLNENKDPVTVLSGFSKLLQDFPDAKLYMIYSEESLKHHVLSFIEINMLLKESVTLIGLVDHKIIDDYYNSADYFVLGSYYEGSGFSLVEAMSCGVIPIVTDISSFRMMTNGGKIGALWRPGDADSFYENTKLLFERSIKMESEKTIDYFNSNLSFPTIGRKAKNFYKSLI